MQTGSSPRISASRTPPGRLSTKQWPFAYPATNPSFSTSTWMASRTHSTPTPTVSTTATAPSPAPLTLSSATLRPFSRNCKMIVRKPMANQACMVTAQGRKERRSTGATVLQNCHIMAEPAFLSTVPPLKAYLGRPWKEFSRTIIMQSLIDGFIAPEGWSVWQGTFALDTLYYGEFKNRGPGSDMLRRVRWKGIQTITPAIAESFTPARLFAGDQWVTQSGIPYVPGMIPNV
ncbi:UNVERIFIED_CONTAM: putative pectinesterase/pectinesterase inhibitor 58 [Sesamum latifolium]|uniref:Pectinesterase/pectinesterase inhibitor 58 n=1 Tax=Sesamum latifolium TaxID=2727402 RepID=A0AAW2XZN3_9LAMI